LAEKRQGEKNRPTDIPFLMPSGIKFELVTIPEVIFFPMRLIRSAFTCSQLHFDVIIYHTSGVIQPENRKRIRFALPLKQFHDRSFMREMPVRFALLGSTPGCMLQPKETVNDPWQTLFDQKTG